MTPLHQNVEKNMQRAHLHLIDSSGEVLSPEIHAACETAFRRVVLDYPQFDSALIADWAEEIAVLMGEREETIQFLRRYAYMALRGRIRDWLRTGQGKAELRGIGPDLEEIAGCSRSTTDQTEREVLCRQILPELSERDRAILVLLLNDQSTTAISTFLGVNYFAAAKAMQRMKDRVSVVLNGKRHKAGDGSEISGLRFTRGIGSES